MPRLRHIHLNEHPYMITTNTMNREPIFADNKAADIAMDAILFGRKQQWYYLLAFVIMPDHLHLVIIPKDKNISECMKSIKGFTAKKINEVLGREGAIWQSGFYDYILNSEDMILTRIRYIEENPVRKGLVINPEEYKYSSSGYRGKTDFGIFF